jgi:hypothetical protein
MNAAKTALSEESKFLDRSQLLSARELNEVRDLWRVAGAATRMDWLGLGASALCRAPRRSCLRRRFSEYGVLNPWNPLTAAVFLADTLVPAFPESEPDLARTLLPPVVTRRFWRPTRFFRQADEYANVCSFPDEHWFFINGILTNPDVARINSACLAHLFHRPLTVIQNATCSGAVDLFECMIGKGLHLCGRRTMTEPAFHATTAILEAINREHVRRVVVVAHSQGTIILSNVLETIGEALRDERAVAEEPKWHAFADRLMGEIRTESRKMLRNSLAHALFEFTRNRSARVEERLRKLELYTFANCADRMRHVLPEDALPYIENFANEYDWVARLGVLSPLLGGEGATVQIDGDLYLQPGEWGHLLNEHYLMAIDDYLYPGPDRHRRHDNPFQPADGGDARPRLYGYFHGKDPDDDPGDPPGGG